MLFWRHSSTLILFPLLFLFSAILTMPKLYFYYSAMNAGKSTTLLQSSFNYHERGMKTLLFLPSICYSAEATSSSQEQHDKDGIVGNGLVSNDGVAGKALDKDIGGRCDSFTLSRLRYGRISCRIGLEAPCILFDRDFDFYQAIEQLLLEKHRNYYHCILIDEAQFLTAIQVNLNGYVLFLSVSHSLITGKSAFTNCELSDPSCPVLWASINVFGRAV